MLTGFRVVALAILLTGGSQLLSCKKNDKQEEPKQDTSIAKGFGYSQERPEGDALVLPQGVSIENPTHIRGYDEYQQELCDNKDPQTAKGIGHMVWICLPFRNNTNRPITITIPHGWVIISKKRTVDTTFRTQNGILVVPVTVQLPPLAVFYQSLRMICLNSDRRFSTANDYFEAGPVTKNRVMLDLLELMNSKQISNDAHAGLMQSIVWKTSEGKEISAREREEINAIPNK